MRYTIKHLAILAAPLIIQACAEGDSTTETELASDPSLKSQVQDLLTEKCIACHDSRPGATIYEELSLIEDFEDGTVDVESSENSPMNRIEPNQPSESYLYRKIEGTHQEAGGSGSRMPLEGGPLTEAQIDLVRRYILSFEQRPVQR